MLGAQPGRQNFRPRRIRRNPFQLFGLAARKKLVLLLENLSVIVRLPANPLFKGTCLFLQVNC